MTYEYFKKIQKLLEVIEQEEKANIDEAVQVFAKTIEEKKSIFVFGASHAGIITQELYGRAGGLMTVTPIFGEEMMLNVEPMRHTSQMERLVGYGTVLAKKVPFKAGDCLLIHSVSGRNPVAIEMAIEAKRLGVTIIALTNLTYSKEVTSRHPSGKNLYAYSDVVIDNHGDIGDAACSIESMDQKVGPTSTVLGAAIVNTIVVETVQKLVANGMENPPIFYSANLDKGDALNQQLFEEYKENIHYKF